MGYNHCYREDKFLGPFPFRPDEYTLLAGKDRIAVFGDVHGRVNQLVGVIQECDIKIALCCGDFLGFSGREERFAILKEADCEIYWCDGNHEDHDYLKLMRDLHGSRKPITFQEAPNVHYCPRGSTITLPDGRKVMFAGGATSIDRLWRLAREEATGEKIWFPEEILTIDDIDWIPEEHVDILISHTCARVNLQHMIRINDLKGVDPTYDALDWVLDRTTPDLWFFGHWHEENEGHFANTYWTALGRDGSFDWWMWLPEKKEEKDEES
jgi:hypothetical protein